VDDAAIRRVGDGMVLVEFEPRLDPAINARALALARLLTRAALPGVRDVVPAYRTVGIHFDPSRADAASLISQMQRLVPRSGDEPLSERPPIVVPVCYGGQYGPDIEEVARFGACTTENVVVLHTSRTYRVCMLGFAPGFAYMAEVDARIASPRRTEPRVRVPAGSVGIAGPQTGVYPQETPGGWQVIGRTPLKVFDPGQAQPFLFSPGDRVTFVSIPPGEVVKLAGL
jgi:inhibitor of KinA